MFAVVEIGSKQYLVKPSDEIEVEKIPQKEGEVFVIDKVLLVYDDKLSVGKPYLKDIVIKAKVIKHFRDKKVKVFRYRPKKRYKKMKGHRQPLTRIKITEVKKEK